MIAVATWVWVVVGIVAFPLAGLLVMLVLGGGGAPADTLRRLAQLGRAGRQDERGRALPPEVPDDRDRDAPRSGR